MSRIPLSRIHPSRSAAVVFAAVACSACSAPGIELDVGFLQSQLSGDATLEPAAIVAAAQSVDVADDLGLNDPSGSVYGRAEIDLSVPHLTFSAFQYDESGQGILSANFGDIAVATAVRSDNTFDNLKSALTFDIEIGPVRVSPGVALSIYDMDLSVQDVGGLVEEEFDETLPVPLLFVQGEVDLSIVSATVDVGALDLEVEDVDGTFVDVEALLKVHPLDHLELFAGYRLIAVDVDGSIDNDDFTADLNLQGWMIGGGVEF